MQQTLHARIQARNMRNENLSVIEMMRRFEIDDHGIIKRWERVYLEEGTEGLAMDRCEKSLNYLVPSFITI